MLPESSILNTCDNGQCADVIMNFIGVEKMKCMFTEI